MEVLKEQEEQKSEVIKSKKEVEFEKIKEVRHKESEVFNALKHLHYKSLISNCYTEMDSYAEMVIDRISPGCLIEGAGGIGKTHRVVNLALDKCQDREVAYLSSFATPQSFFIQLYKSRDAGVIIIDDVYGIIENPKCVSMLKGATWEVNGKRLVEYLTTKPMQDEWGEFVPNRFEINAGIIIITNYLNRKSAHVNAVLSRINHCKVELPKDELLLILGQITEKGYEGLVLDECRECFEYLKDQTKDSETYEDLNLRTLFKMFMFKKYNKSNTSLDSLYWQVLTKKMLKQDDKLVIIEKLVNDEAYESEEKRVQAFIEMTGKSRVTYFRLKKKLEAKSRKNYEVPKLQVS